jgi:glucose-like phosphotransferase system IIB component
LTIFATQGFEVFVQQSHGIFNFFIRRFDLKTPGRGDDDNIAAQLTTADQAGTAPVPAGTATSETAILAQRYVQALGGRDNLKTIDSCITRLRLTLVNRDIVSDASLKALGAKGVIRPGQDGMQVIVGPIADTIADEMRRIPSGTTSPASRTSTAPAIAPPLVLAANGSDGVASSEVVHNGQALIQALGGRRNIRQLEAIALTRLRLNVDDKTQINSTALEEAGVKAVMDFPDTHLLHLLIGLNAEQYADEMQKQLTSQRN